MPCFIVMRSIIMISNVHLIGEGEEETILDAESLSQGMHFNSCSNIVVANLTMTGGHYNVGQISYGGGGMEFQSSNNITITINVDKSGGASEASASDGNEGESDRMDKLSAKVKEQVVTIIKEESRPGGMLDNGE